MSNNVNYNDPKLRKAQALRFAAFLQDKPFGHDGTGEDLFFGFEYESLDVFAAGIRREMLKAEYAPGLVCHMAITELKGLVANLERVLVAIEAEPAA
jgi:hypothetical protein